MDNQIQAIKKHILEYGIRWTNGSKIIAVLYSMIFNIIFYAQHGTYMKFDDEKSLLITCIFIFAPFLPIDINLVIQAVLKKSD